MKRIILMSFLLCANLSGSLGRECIQGGETIQEGEKLVVRITACDPDGDTVTIEIDNLPAGAILIGNPEPIGPIVPCDPNCAGPKTLFYEAIFEWTPTFEQSGTYNLNVRAFDDKGGQDWVVFVINVLERNRPPYIFGCDRQN